MEKNTFDFQVEVQGENSAYYRAHVVDVFETEILLRFEDDWQPPSRFPFPRIRLPPPPPLPPENAVRYSEGEEIEVYSRASDQVIKRQYQNYDVTLVCQYVINNAETLNK